MYNCPIYVYKYTQINTKSQYKDTQMNTSERLKQVMEVKGFNLKTFSEQADIPYRTLQNYILTNREPSAESLAKLHSQLGINLNWLMSGNGEMFTNNTEIIDLTKLEKELLESYQSCDNSTQRKINLAISAIAQDKE
jgi:transcriptional regulator with XRE-family HTH domain